MKTQTQSQARKATAAAAGKTTPQAAALAGTDHPPGRACDDAQSNALIAALNADKEQRIAAEAYRIAEEQGFPGGADLHHWFEAEKRLGLDGSHSILAGGAAEREAHDREDHNNP
jgi:hypothetical protein